MKTMTTKERTELGKDVRMAVMAVLHKHGFSAVEISAIMDAPESVVRNYINRIENDK